METEGGCCISVEAGSRFSSNVVAPFQTCSASEKVENHEEHRPRQWKDPFEGYWLYHVLRELAHTRHGPSGGCIRFCPDEKKVEESTDDYILDELRAELSVPKWSAKSPLSVSGGVCIGSVLKNTFVHIAPPPITTQEHGAQSRSRSLPRDFGSMKDTWSATRHSFNFAPADNSGDCMLSLLLFQSKMQH